MARTCRNNLPNVVYHCITRFVDREWFFEDDIERAKYLYYLGKALEHTDWKCIGYALMSNHIHLAMVAGREPMESWSKATHAPFASWMNHRHNRLGPVMAHRPKDFRITAVNVGSVVAYIHNNPVRAGVVRRASQSTWTSHLAYLDEAAAPKCLSVAEGLARCGFEDRYVFDEWIDRTPGNAFDVALERQAIMLRKRGALMFGTPTVTADPTDTSLPLWGRPHFHVRPDPRRVVAVVAELADVAAPVIRSRRRLSFAIDARRVIAHCGAALGIALSDIASALGVSPTSVGAMTRRELGEHLRIVYDLAYERLSLEMWGEKEPYVRPPDVQVELSSDGVPNRLSETLSGVVV